MSARRTTGRMSGRTFPSSPSFPSFPPCLQLLFYVSLRWQQIIVMFCVGYFAHNSAVLRPAVVVELFGVCYSYAACTFKSNEPRHAPQIDMPWRIWYAKHFLRCSRFQFGRQPARPTIVVVIMQRQRVIEREGGGGGRQQAEQQREHVAACRI